MDNQLISHLN